MPASLKKRCETNRIAAIAITAHIAIAFLPDCTLAQSQIVPDNTLPENSIVTPNYQGLPVEVIDGGTQQGVNLFHSFREFNVSEGRSAYFINPTGVENILSRVTGDKVSQILGTLGVLGNANLFLINPNGIIFGQNVSLDVQGSFIVTTANAIQFGDRGFFSATNPQSPSSLLTVNPSAFLFNQIQTAQIKNQSNLQVPNGQSLLLVGGEILIDGGKLFAPGGRVELAAIGGTGTVGLNLDSNLLNLDIPENITGANISLTKGAEVNVRAGGGGDIAINAQNLTLDGESNLRAGIDEGLGSFNARAGNIEINAKGNVTFSNGSFISNSILEKAKGNGGNIEILADSLDLNNGSQISDSTFGEGNAGNLIINASNRVSLDTSYFFNTVGTEGIGNAGNIEINTPNLFLTNGAQIITVTDNIGNAGNVIIKDANTVSLDGKDSDGLSSAIFTRVDDTGVGKGGNIDIITNNLSLSNGALLDTRTFGEGDAGDINFTASNISLSNGSFLYTNTVGQGNAGDITIKAPESVFLDSSYALSGLGGQGIGNGGTIDIETDLLTLDNVAVLDVFGAGGGSIRVNARNVDILGGSIIRGGIVQGLGTIDTQAGNLEINATERIKLEGNSTNTAGIISVVQEGGLGNAGDVVINTKTLEGSGHFLISSVLSGGQGNTGDITITATEKISLLGDSITNDDGTTTSLGFISTSVLDSGKGNAGNISITTPSLLLVNSNIDSNIAKEAAGNGGNIQINATESVTASGSSSVSASNSGLGNAGNVVINAPTGTVAFDEGASVSTDVFASANSGQGGDIFVRARNLSLSNNNAGLSSFTYGKGNAGNIEIQATDSVSVSSQSVLITSTFGAGNAGNINIEAPNGTVSFDGLFTIASTSVLLDPTTLLGATGQGGDIFIKARSLSLSNGAILGSFTVGREGANGGNIEVNVSDSVLVSGGGGFSSATAGQGNAGKVTINAGGAVSFDGTKVVDVNDPILNNPNTSIPFNFFAEGTLINNKFLLLFSGIENLVGSSTNFQGNGRGGDINITAQSLSLTNGALINASTNGKGDAGNVNIDVRDGVNLSGFTTVNLDGVDVGSFNVIGTAVTEAGVGQGGNITIKARSLTMNDLSEINASTFGQGKAGNIDLQVDDSVILTNLSQIRSAVNQGGVGDGGNIDISGRSLTLINGGEISASVKKQAFNLPAARGNGGNIRINTTDFVNISGFNSIRFPNRDFNNLEEIPTEGFASGLFVSTETGTSGSAGTITVTTGDFRIADGAIVGASTANAFNAGSITINAKTFEATGGGQVSSGTDSGGTAGNITLNISDSIVLSGSDPTYADQLARYGVEIVGDLGAESGVFASTSPQSTGRGGNIFLNSGRLTVRDSAKIVVDSQGTGVGGNVDINTDFLTLSDRASISAETASNTGGNLDLQVGDLLLLRNGSNISTTAGIARARGDGGNIDIDAKFIFAVPNEDSNITANAFEGKGGNINITTRGIFGIQFREQETPLSDITASSQFGTQGQVAIAEPNVDFTKTIVQLPSLIDPSGQIARGCPSQGRISAEQLGSFTITGRGGLPPSPTDPRSSDAVFSDWATIEPEGESEATNVETQVLTERIAKPIIEAQGWVRGSKGEIVLFAQVPHLAPYSPTIPNNNCSGLMSVK